MPEGERDERSRQREERRRGPGVCVWGGWLVEGVRSFGRTERDALRGRSSRR